MTDDPASSEGRRWLVEPPGPQQVTFRIAAGDQVEIGPEIREAFERLVEALASAEVEGFDMAADCPAYKKGCTTNTFDCVTRGKCVWEAQAPCLMQYHCIIAP